MNATTTTAPAQVGMGRIVHQAPEGADTTLCDRPVSRFLTRADVTSMRKRCAQCAKVAERQAAEQVTETPATEQAPAAPAEQAPEYRTLKGVGANGAFQLYGDLHEVRGNLVFTSWGTAKQLKGEAHTFTRQWTERGYRYLEDAQGRIVEFNGGTATKVWLLDGVQAPAAEEPQAPAVEDAPEAPEVDEAPAEVAEVADAPEADDAPAVEDAPEVPEVDEAVPALGEQVRVTAYTAALQALRLNGKDSADTTLTLPAVDLLETVAAMRRMPRWNDEQQRLVVNKVALIVATSAEGERVWVRGEAAPIRVDLQGNPIAEDAPAEPGTVDGAAVLKATRLLRRRAEVQRVIDNRTAARAMSATA
ncbi:hypothetical protein [Streptomyces sp. KAU_LT]|uniref:hypothetical protein n=1 Tax=Streptomyces sp. KAU_LT TaxID=3046669 RepID=UPI0024B6F822|nr:hypothetical protein [Streptomyces sp. KAU_LT]MDI9836256.1 hypothetical protein [Streptomyces sp. KAU_LT]